MGLEEEIIDCYKLVRVTSSELSVIELNLQIRDLEIFKNGKLDGKKI